MNKKEIIIKIKILIREGWPISVAGLIKFLASISATAWSAHLSSNDVAMLAMSMMILGAISSVSLGISILSQVKLGPYKSTKELPGDLFSNLLMSGALFGFTACALTYFSAPVLVKISSWQGSILEENFVNTIQILSWTLPTVTCSAVVGIGLIVEGKSKWILFTAITSTTLALIGLPLAIHANTNPSIITVAKLNLFISIFSTLLMALPLVKKITKPKFKNLVHLYAGSNAYMVWPSVEQITIMGLIITWQQLVSSVSVETLAAAGIAMSYFGICQPLIRGVSQLTSIELSSNRNNKSVWRYIIIAGVVAALVVTGPILLLGFFMPYAVLWGMGISSENNLFDYALRLFSIGYAFGIISSVISASLAVLGYAKSVFIGDSLSLLCFGVAGAWLLIGLEMATPEVILISYAVYQIVMFIYVFIVARRQTEDIQV